MVGGCGPRLVTALIVLLVLHGIYNGVQFNADPDSVSQSNGDVILVSQIFSLSFPFDKFQRKYL